MRHRELVRWLIPAIIAVIALSPSAFSAQAPKSSGNWLATGVVTRVSSGVFYLLGKDDVIYRIDANRARVLLNDKPAEFSDILVGDKVRVFGRKIGEKRIRAIQLNVLVSVPPIEVVPPEKPSETPQPPPAVEPPVETPSPVPPKPTPPAEVPPTTVPSPLLPEAGQGPAPAPSFTARGLVKDVHLTEGWMVLLTNKGPVEIDISEAQVYSKGKPTSFSDISVGDALFVQGNRLSEGQVVATRIDILAQKVTAESSKPVSPVSTVGSIKSLDYPSHTFVVDNGAASIFVVGDDHTNILSPVGKPMKFSDLRLGMRVKVSGLGSLTTGYLARQIVVIGSPR